MQANKAVKEVELNIDMSKYFNEGNEAFTIYQAAVLMDSNYAKDRALSKSISKAIEQKDLKLALIAAREIESNYAKDKQLLIIAQMAAMEKSTVGYAIIAADLSESGYNKDRILKGVIASYDESNPSGLLIDPLNPSDRLDDKDLTDFEKYKIIFNFAESGSFMDMSEKDAKAFTDNWVKERTYEEFLYFRKIYIFADSPSFMDMDEEDATEFALRWLSNGYAAEDFEVFSDVFKFAESSGGMNMSVDEATTFAFEKLQAHKVKSASN